MPVVTALLERWLDVADVTTAHDALAEVLERVVTATQIRNPLIGELARSVRYRYFDQPQNLAYRAKVIAAVREQLAYLVANPDAPDRAERVEEMVVSPEPIIGLMSEWIGTHTADLGPLLEVLTRRYYRTRVLEEVRLFHQDQRQFVTSEFDLAETRLHLITTVGDFSEVDDLAAALNIVAAGTDAWEPRTLVVDIFVSWADAPSDHDAMAEALRVAAAQLSLPDTLGGVTVGIAGGELAARAHYFTFRPEPDGTLVEDRLIRGLHPLVAQRLDFKRLVNFQLTRLPADYGFYLFRGVGNQNSHD